MKRMIIYYVSYSSVWGWTLMGVWRQELGELIKGEFSLVLEFTFYSGLLLRRINIRIDGKALLPCPYLG